MRIRVATVALATATMLAVAAPAATAGIPPGSTSDGMNPFTPSIFNLKPEPKPEPAFDAELATVDGVVLHVPAVETAAVGFHEGSTQSVPMTPADGHMQLPSRGRPSAPTTAVDVAVTDDHTAVAPVAGTVVAVAEYALYGNVADVQIHIVPDGSSRTVRLLHVTDVQVAVGQRVEVGQHVASARQLPFGSQVDRFHPGPAGPHIHLEVR